MNHRTQQIYTLGPDEIRDAVWAYLKARGLPTPPKWEDISMAICNNNSITFSFITEVS